MSEDIQYSDRHTVFPVWLFEEVLDLLKQRDARFKLFGNCVVGGWLDRPQWGWPGEYARARGFGNGPIAVGQAFVSRWAVRRRWKGSARFVPRSLFEPPVGIEMFLHHDADRAPERTLATMRLEESRGIVSSNYFFRRSAYPDDESYDVNVPALQVFEKKGFEIGYHQNAYELSDYQEARALQIADDDADWFRERFNLRSFVPHGGRRGPGGVNNDNLDWFGGKTQAIWAYNRYGILTDFGWSDGGVESKASPEDPREFVRRLPDNCRVRMLLHPQYYGLRPRLDVDNLPIARQEWWKRLW